MTDEIRLWKIGANESLEEIDRSRLDLEARLAITAPCLSDRRLRA